MPVITISREFRSHKVNVSPSTILQDVLIKSLQYFKLPYNKDSNNEYRLITKDNKELDLSLPFRFLNLPQGANLELVGEPMPLKSSSSPPSTTTRSEKFDESINTNDLVGLESKKNFTELVNIRASVSIGDEFYTKMQKFSNSISVSEMIELFIGPNHSLDENWSIQLMMDIVKRESWGLPLSQVGMKKGNHAIRIRLLKINNNKNNNTNMLKNQTNISESFNKNVNNDVDKQKMEEKKDTEKIEKQIENISNSTDFNSDIPVDTMQKSQLEHSKELPVEIKYIENKSGYKIEDSDNSLYELSIEQARTYQKILAKQSAEQPLLTKALRDKLHQQEVERKEKMKASLHKDDCSIRIKFPDNSVVQVTMDKRKTLKDLVDTIINDILRLELVQNAGKVFNDKVFFELTVALPFREVLSPRSSDTQLTQTIAECDFGNRVFFVFKLDERIINHVDLSNGYVQTKLLEPKDVKVEVEVPATDKSIDEPVDEHVDKHFDKSVADEPVNKTLRKLPNWVKLHKK